MLGVVERRRVAIDSQLRWKPGGRKRGVQGVWPDGSWRQIGLHGTAKICQ